MDSKFAGLLSNAMDLQSRTHAGKCLTCFEILFCFFFHITFFAVTGYMLFHPNESDADKWSDLKFCNLPYVVVPDMPFNTPTWPETPCQYDSDY